MKKALPGQRHIGTRSQAINNESLVKNCWNLSQLEKIIQAFSSTAGVCCASLNHCCTFIKKDLKTRLKGTTQCSKSHILIISRRSETMTNFESTNTRWGYFFHVNLVNILRLLILSGYPSLTRGT